MRSSVSVSVLEPEGELSQGQKGVRERDFRFPEHSDQFLFTCRSYSLLERDFIMGSKVTRPNYHGLSCRTHRRSTAQRRKGGASQTQRFFLSLEQVPLTEGV